MSNYKEYRIMNTVMVIISLLNLAVAEDIQSFCYSLAVVIYAFSTKELLDAPESEVKE